VADICNTLKIDKYHFDNLEEFPHYAHSGRVAKLIVRGQEVGIVGEISPLVTQNFDITERIGFFKLDITKLESSVFTTVKAHEVSSFQENNFDINFVADKGVKGKDIQIAIEKTDIELIQKVELFDIYENEEKLSGQRSFSYKVHFGSLEKTLDDTVKNNLIKDIVSKVEKKGGKLR